MRIAELSQRAGVPVPTIKYYLREGMLPAGELTSPNQARYDEQHLLRLRLIRALVDVGRLPIARIRDLLAEIDRPDVTPHEKLGRVLSATDRPLDPGADDAVAAATADVDDLITRRGWHISPDAPARPALAAAIAALRRLGGDDIVEMLDSYAEVADRTAALDLDVVRGRLADPDSMVHGALIGTVIGDSILSALRRLAQEDASARMFGT